MPFEPKRVSHQTGFIPAARKFSPADQKCVSLLHGGNWEDGGDLSEEQLKGSQTEVIQPPLSQREEEHRPRSVNRRSARVSRLPHSSIRTFSERTVQNRLSLEFGFYTVKHKS